MFGWHLFLVSTHRLQGLFETAERQLDKLRTKIVDQRFDKEASDSWCKPGIIGAERVRASVCFFCLSFVQASVVDPHVLAELYIGELNPDGLELKRMEMGLVNTAELRAPALQSHCLIWLCRQGQHHIHGICAAAQTLRAN